MQLRSCIMNRLFQYRIYSTLLFAACVVFAHGLPAHAATTTYDGCFERSTDGTTREIWISAPICTVTLDGNIGESAQQFSVKNLDPKFYKVTDETTHTTQATTIQDNALTFSIVASTLHTITIKPWDESAVTATDFWFAAISDNQPEADGGESPNPTFLTLMDQLQPLHMPFLTDSGDLIDGNAANAAAHDAEYVSLTNVFESYEGSTYMVPGDHDSKNDLDAYYSTYFGERDFTFVYGNTRFIGINDTENVDQEGVLTTDQLTWIESTLAAATEEHIIILMQHPLIAPDWSTASPLDSTQAQQLAEWFVQYNVDIAIVGNSHGYDDRTIDDVYFPGMNGSYEQLIVAGAGGTYHGYDGENFYVLVHVSDTGIEHQKIDLPDSDTALTYTTVNDGTTAAVSATLTNIGAIDIPYMRFPVLLDSTQTSSRLYASTVAGDWYTVTSTEINSVRYAYAELAVPAGTDTTITIAEQRNIVSTVQNTVDTDGVITFATLPTVGAVTTDLQVTASDAQTTVSAATWDTTTATREWSEQTTAYNSTTFAVAGLLPNRQYTVYVNEKIRTRIVTDETGATTYTFAGKATTRNYHMQLYTRILPTTIGVGPSGQESPRMRMIDAATQDTTNSFYSYESDLQTGISSVWIDTDGDGALELATVPDSGTPGHVRVFRQSGGVISSVFPYGESFTGGITLVAADVDGDGDQELLTAPKSSNYSRVKIYDFRPGVFEKIDSFRVYKKQYKGGVNIAAGDMNADGIDEVIVGARKKKDVLKIYQWNSGTAQMDTLLVVQPFTESETENSGKGFSIAVGDVDFNGKADLLVGSRSGNSKVVAYRYKRSTNSLRQISSGYAFDRTYIGGVDLCTANVNASDQDEVIVSGRAQTPESASVSTFSASTNHMQSLGTISPFGADYRDGINIAFMDTDSDFRAELATSREVGEDRILVYDKRSNGYAQIESFSVYGDTFSGGLRLTE